MPSEPRNEASPKEAEQTVGSDGVTLSADDVIEVIYYLERWREVRQLVEGQNARNSHVERLIRTLGQGVGSI